jgi:hypothetical protein
MSPVCIGAAAVIAGRATSSGGFAALVVKKVFLKNARSRFQNLGFPKSVKLKTPISPPLYSSYGVFFSEIFSPFIRLQR